MLVVSLLPGHTLTLVSLLVRKVKGPTPHASNHHSRPSYQQTLAEVHQQLQRYPSNHQEAKKSVRLDLI